MVKHYGDMNLEREDEARVRELYRRVPVGEGTQNRITRADLTKRAERGCRRWLLDGRQGEQVRHTARRAGSRRPSIFGVGGRDGGSVYRVPRGTRNEKDYYPPLAREIEQGWAAAKGREYHRDGRFLRVLETAFLGKRVTGGKWTRPDITLIGGKVLPYLPGKHLDVVTFEVKHQADETKHPLDITGLYEALAHRTFGNFAYVIYVVPQKNQLDEVQSARITVEATRTGVGVIYARQEDDFALWEETVEPVRHWPDPQKQHDFLTTQCEEILPDLAKWIAKDVSFSHHRS